MNEINNEFGKTCKLIFGREIGSIEKYDEWLGMRLPLGEEVKSIDGKEIYVPQYSIFRDIPKSKIASLDYLEDAQNMEIEINEEDGVKDISKKLEKIATFIVESKNGKNLGVDKSLIYNNLYYAYKTIDCSNSKYISHGFWNEKCESLFGGHRNYAIRYSIHVYNSKNISNGFEIESSKDCSNVMFLHNCFNVHNSMFCFNTQNKNYAIANIEVGEDIYEKIKEMFIEAVVSKLKKDRYLPIDIFNIGAKK